MDFRGLSGKPRCDGKIVGMRQGRRRCSAWGPRAPCRRSVAFSRRANRL
ncbi:hypothetical protein PY32053_00284 [Paracoccus yeei]|uniref:Uncharacterized protein n=1 Tax=Paracoccus yeei TaxID=147645 RepID=A0A386UJ68_9RHOB|nr:hypothetical protein PY32053_00284 [Paracoccus yeei]